MIAAFTSKRRIVKGGGSIERKEQNTDCPMRIDSRCCEIYFQMPNRKHK